MNKTVNLNDNYGKKLRDEMINSDTGLRGEVEINVRNKETGALESQQKHNLIVYGGREWLMKKAFCSNIAEGSDFISNSEILWFGVGDGGSEPGNPLQCGCTYGSDNDLYNPIRLRYEFSTAGAINPYYASRIMPNGEVVNGYYKKITYVSIKEDMANPYKRNNTILYPNLIAEIRLEINSDDCCGQTYLHSDIEKSYADINEAALFIADKRKNDPGVDDSVSQQFIDYTEYNDSRIDLPQNEKLPDYIKSEGSMKYEWTTEKPFTNNNVQYYNIYIAGKKINKQPIFLGIYSDKNNCTGSVTYDKPSGTVTFMFECDGKSVTKEVTDIPPTVDSLDNLDILTNGTIAINIVKSGSLIHKEDKDVLCSCLYRNSYTTDFTPVTNVETLPWSKDGEYKYWLPVGYSLDIESGKLVEDNSFTLRSIVRVVQSNDTATSITIDEILIDPSSLECRCYVSHKTVKDIKEGMKIYTFSGEITNKIPKESPKKIIEVYDAEMDTGVTGTSVRSYFVIEKEGFVNEKYPDGLGAKVYSDSKNSPYIMFNRVTFSTIRVSRNRLVDLVWRIYF